MSERGKYIIVDSSAYHEPILFPCTISHDDFLRMFNRDRIVSAGFFEVGAGENKNDPTDISVFVWGKSTSLKIDSQKEDADYIKRMLRKPDMW